MGYVLKDKTIKGTMNIKSNYFNLNDFMESTPTTTATTKFHTGKELGQTSPNSQLKSDEIFSKIQTVETVLDSRSSGIFDNIIRNVSLQGGSNNITSNIGTNQID